MAEESLKDQRAQLVVKSNDIIQKARYQLTATQQKFICYLVSLIKPTDEDFQEYVVKVEDFCKLTGIDKNHFYGEFRQMVDDLDVNKSFWIRTDKEIYKFRWLADSRYMIGEGTIKVTLSKTLKEYLIGLNEKFTQYELINILALRSKYSVRLFEVFKSYSYKKEKEFGIDELKQLLDAEKYVNYKDFRRRVLEVAKQEINECTELTVDFDEIRKGRKVIAIRFTIEQKGPSDRYKSYQKTVKKIEAGRS